MASLGPSSAASSWLARSALVACGLQGKELEIYMGKLQRVVEELKSHFPSGGWGAREGAVFLFRWLWGQKPKRYRYQGPFQLPQVLDAQLDPATEEVGNCLGLTLLYNTLAQGLGLSVKAAHLEEAFGLGPHVFSLLEIEREAIDIENVFPDGFDFPGHRASPGREIWGDVELLADLYHSLGNSRFEQGDLEGALRHYEEATRLNPGYTKAYLNRGITLSLLGRREEAERVFRSAPSGA